MSGKDKCITHEIISLKKPSALDKVIDIVPKPQGAVPNFGLPKWKMMSLESKIPMVPGPKNAYCFTRRKLGKRLWLRTRSTDFDLTDPYNYEIKFPYDILHDEHLASVLSRPKNIKRLIKLGFVTEDLDAKCSLKDYNVYRRYLKKLHNDSINKELKLRAELNDERRVLQLAEERIKNYMERLSEKEKKDKIRQEAREKLKLEEEARIRKLKENIVKATQRYNLVAISKKETALRLLEKARTKSEHIQQKRMAATEIERQRIIKTLIQWKRSERERKKAVKQRLIKERESKLKSMEEKWEMRQEHQKKQMDREQFLINCLQEERQMFIQEYNKKVDRHRKKIQSCLKKQKRLRKCYAARTIPGNKKRICCRIPHEKKQSQSKEDKGNKKALCPPKAQASLTEDKIAKMRDKIEKERKGEMKLQKTKVKRKKISTMNKTKCAKKQELLEQQKDEVLSELQEERDAVLNLMKLEKFASQPLLFLMPKDKCKCKKIQDMRNIVK